MSESLKIAPFPATTLLRLPHADPAVTHEVIDHLVVMLAALPAIRVRVAMRHAVAIDIDRVPVDGQALCLIVPLLETCLDREPAERSPKLIAQLGFMSMLPALPETMALQIAFGLGGDAQVLQMARVIARAMRRSGSGDEYAPELCTPGAMPRTALGRLFQGETRRVPDFERMACGVALLRATASLMPLAFRPPLLCAIAWLQWARGKRPISMAYLAEAVRIEPEYVLADGS